MKTQILLSSRSTPSAARIGTAILTLLLAAGAFASSAREKLVYSFQGAAEGAYPNGLTADSSGNLFGTTESGGDAACNCGTVFVLTPPHAKGEAWTETALYRFQGGVDGSVPLGTVIFDKTGNLYGTTGLGGASNYGTVFELTPPAAEGGAWTESVIYSFPSDGSHGYQPSGGMAFDPYGNLYGTSAFGGKGTACTGQTGCGTVFQLTPPAVPGGEWIQSVVHSFGAYQGDGIYPGGLVFDRGVLYGTTQNGGSPNPYGGTVFQIMRKDGAWNESVIFSFGNTAGDGQHPRAPFIDGSGNVFVPTVNGGSSTNCSIYGCGTVVELKPPAIAGKPWTEIILCSFADGKDGAYPTTGLISDKAGNLFGMTQTGGLRNKLTRDNGTIFELSPPTVPGGAWTETTVHECAGSAYNDCDGPGGNLVIENGTFYFVAGGGPLSFGAMFGLIIEP